MPHRPRGHQLGLLNSRLNLLCQRWEVNQRGDRWGGSGWDIQEPPTLCQTLHLAYIISSNSHNLRDRNH